MTKIFQIETTNYCNGRCSYCPTGTKKMKRTGAFISKDALEAALEIFEPCHQQVYPFNEVHAENTVELHHFGEPLIHPDILSIVQTVRNKGIGPILGTNGLLLSLLVAQRLVHHGVHSLHVQWNRFEPLRGILDALSMGCPVTVIVIGGLDHINTTQVEMIKDSGGTVYSKKLRNFGGEEQFDAASLGAKNCIWLKEDWKIVLSNGTLVTCCNDYEGISNRGNINGGPIKKNEYFSLCEGCAGYAFDHDSEGEFL